MSASELIVDASSWIDFFHGVELPGLEAALERGRVVLPPIVVSELVSGARTPRDLALITDLLVDLPVHQTPLEHWIRVGELRDRQVRRRFVASPRRLASGWRA